MNVLFLTHSYPRRAGDAPGSFLLRLAVALRDEGIGVRVLAPGASGLPAEETIDGVPVRRFRYAPRRWENLAYGGTMAELVRERWSARAALAGFLASEGAAAVREIRRRRVDLLHAHWWFPSGLVAAAAGRIARLPLVTTMHGSDVRIARDTSAARPAFRRVLGASAAVTTVSHWLAEQVTAIAPEVRPLVAPMPVATALFAGAAPEGDRRTDGLLFVGRLTRQKGVDRLLRALAGMRTPAQLTIVGEGPEEAALRTLAGALGVSPRVRWYGMLPQRELAAHYRQAMVLVVPSHEEGLGLVAVEGMLAATPVVAFDSGGVRDVVQDGRTGVLVPAGDVTALGRALDELLADGAAHRRRALGMEGRRLALASFSPGAVARRYADIYREAVRARAS